jgi:hypothetical protein
LRGRTRQHKGNTEPTAIGGIGRIGKSDTVSTRKTAKIKPWATKLGKDHSVDISNKIFRRTLNFKLRFLTCQI